MGFALADFSPPRSERTTWKPQEPLLRLSPLVSARKRSVRLLPRRDAAADMAGGLEARVLRRLHRHRRTLAEGAVEQDALAGRGRKFVQPAARRDLLLQARVWTQLTHSQ